MGEEIQRARILRAIAEAMALREDPQGVTVADVLALARVSRRAFYELYADRDDCFLAAFEWALQIAGEEMYLAYTRQARWQDGIRMGLAAFLALLEREPALARLGVVYALGAGGPVLQRRMEAIEVLREFVDRGRLEGAGRIEPPEVAAEGVVGAVLAVIHARLLTADASRASANPGAPADASGSTERASPLTTENPGPLTELLGPLMSLILLPYLGAAKASRELTRPAPRAVVLSSGAENGSGGEAGMRLTYRTARVLRVIGERPGASNREVADEAGIVDQGQISRLVNRLESLGLIANVGGTVSRGTANAWVLTPTGEQVERGVQLARQPPRPMRR